MGEITSMAALLCSVISIKLMTIVEGAQVVVSGTIGRLPQPDRVVAMTMGTPKFFVLRVGIVFFSRISWLIFTVEGMYNGKVIQKAASTVMKTSSAQPSVTQNSCIGPRPHRLLRGHGQVNRRYILLVQNRWVSYRLPARWVFTSWRRLPRRRRTSAAYSA